MLNELIKVTGKLDIVRTDANNNVVEQIRVPNLVVTTGKNFIANRLVTNATLMSHMALGTNDTTTDVAQTALIAENARVALSSQTNFNNTATYVASFGPGVGTGALREAGIFAAASGGIMLCRTIFNVINKNPSDTVTISWVITIS
jgi:hypothetical protein